MSNSNFCSPKFISEISALHGVSGREENVRNFIVEQLPKDVSYTVDNMGNLLVHKAGKAKPRKKLMMCAHMDEVGLIVTYITDSGYLKFDTLGGIDPAVIIGKPVTLESGVTGIVALKHIHQCNSEDSSTLPPISALCIDIGASDKAEAEKYVTLGDYAVFDSEFTEFGTDNSSIKAKALDDRLGCALMLELINSESEFDVDFAFTVQEEVGARGALAATYAVNPDIAIVIETTTAGDICDVSGEKRACVLGGGPVVSYMDKGTVYDHKLYKMAMEIAEKNSIPVQTKTLVAGGNDSSSVQRTGNGVRTLAVSLPCRYLHSPSCVINKDDIVSMQKLLLKLTELTLIDL